MYEIMRYWDDDLPDWDAEDRDFAGVWRNQRKWVVSRSLKSVGPNATLIEDDFEAAILDPRYVPGWTTKGHPGYWGYAWYRIRVPVTSVPGQSSEASETRPSSTSPSRRPLR
jgi:hypothetical protein